MLIKISVPHLLPKERKIWKDLWNTHQKFPLVIWKLKRKIKIISFSLGIISEICLLKDNWKTQPH